MYKIDENIKIPKARTIAKNKKKLWEPNGYPFGLLKVGNSFFVKCEYFDQTYIKVVANTRYQARTLNYKFVTRFIGDGLRIWRVRNNA